MRDNSNTFIYIIASIIILHFLVGFGFLIYKMTQKSAPQKELKNDVKDDVKDDDENNKKS